MRSIKKPFNMVPLAVGAFIVGSLAPMAAARATDNPFASSDLAGGYMVVGRDDETGPKEGKCGGGKCGGNKAQEAVCGIYQIGSAHKDSSKVKDGKCGGHKVVEALCGG
jgi:uncharacterized low-complexity protein